MVSTLSKFLTLTYYDACVSQSALATDSAAVTLTLSLRLRRCFSDYSAVRILLCPRLQISSCSSLSYATSDLFPFSTTRFSNLSAPLSQASTTLSFRIYHLYGVLATSHRLGIVIDTDLGKLRSALREIVNPYENAIFVIGKTLAPSNEDNFISCFGFVDSTTHGDEVFSLHSDNSPSHGLEMSYHVTEDSHLTFLYQGQYRMNCSSMLLSTLLNRATASFMFWGNSDNKRKQLFLNVSSSHISAHMPIVLVSVGDGPWADMRKMGDLIPKRVDLSEIMREGPSELAKEREFSLTDLICDSDEEWIRGGVLLDDLLVAEDLASVETTYDASHAVRYEDALS
ncbi:hypothetical protein Bca101_093263 [Brassica carinata]